MGTTYLHGLVALREGHIDAARELPFLGVCCYDRARGAFIVPKSLNGLALGDSTYDREQGLWHFTLQLHDDTMPNADTGVLEAFLQSVPLDRGRGLILTNEDWQSRPSWLMCLNDGSIVERFIVDDQEDGDESVTLPEARDLIASLEWAAADVLFEQLSKED